MFRFLFFLITIVIIWYILDAVLRSVRIVFGGRQSHRREPVDERNAGSVQKTAIEMRDVKDAEFKDVPPENPKGTP